MGCRESQMTKGGEKTQVQNRQFSQIVPAAIDVESFEVQQVTNNHKKIVKMQSFNSAEVSMRSKENEVLSIEDNQDSKIKVKKARNYIIRPQHERFIENILQTNRNKAVTEFPTTFNKSLLPHVKKNATSLHTKPQESATGKQNIEGIKQKAQKTPMTEVKYSKKQRERLMNKITLGKLNQQELNQIGERIDLEQLDSDATIRL